MGIAAGLALGWASPTRANYTFTTLASFSYYANGAYPYGGHLAFDANGNIYGTASLGGPGGWGTVFRYSASAGSLAPLASFGNNTVGAQPYGGVAFDTTGNIYGTLSTDHLLQGYLFGPQDFGSVHGVPAPGLATDAAGNIYGAVSGDVPLSGGPDYVFKLVPGANAITKLAAFDSNGYGPNSPTIDAHGNIYGTTQFGGPENLGTVFKVDTSAHSIVTLATFSGINGANPTGGLTTDADGNLYGTTTFGGNGYSAQSLGAGTVFKIDASTRSITTLVSFDGLNGSHPKGGLVEDANGNLFGTTTSKQPDFDGTVFEINAATHLLTNLVAFTGPNGSSPEAGLIADASGNIYGTTRYGGVNNEGTIFELSVPEPNSLATLGIAALAMLLLRCRRRTACGVRIGHSSTCGLPGALFECFVMKLRNRWRAYPFQGQPAHPSGGRSGMGCNGRRKSHVVTISLATAVGTIVACAGAAFGQYNFTTFDVPGVASTIPLGFAGSSISVTLITASATLTAVFSSTMGPVTQR